MADPQVKLVLTADASQLSSEIAKLQRQFAAMGGAGGAGSAFKDATASADTFQQQLKGMIGRFSAVWAGIKSIQGLAAGMNFGIEFQAQMEDARLGIASLIAAQGQLKDSTGRTVYAQDALNVAMALGTDQIQQLRIAGLQTKATTEQLVGAYQDALGAGLGAQLSLDEIRKVTVATVQAAGAMGVPMTQLNQEIRSILSGTIDRNSRVAKVLGIDNKDVEAWKAAGTLYENLMGKMSAFATAGKASMNNWRTLLSNVMEASQILVGTAVKEPMDRIREFMATTLNTIMDTSSAQIQAGMQPVMGFLRDIAGMIADAFIYGVTGAINGLRNLSVWWMANREAIMQLITTFKQFVTSTLSFIGGVAGTLIGWIADIVVWWTKWPEALKSATVALLAFLVVAYKLSDITTTISTMGKAFQSLTTVISYTVSYGVEGLKYALTSMLSPTTLIVAAVVALGAACWYLAGSADRAAKAMDDLNKQHNEGNAALLDYSSRVREIASALKEAKPGTDEFTAAQSRKAQVIKELGEKYPDFLQFMDLEQNKTKELTEIMKEFVAQKRLQLEIEVGLQEVTRNQVYNELAAEQKKLDMLEAQGSATGELGTQIDDARMRVSVLKGQWEQINTAIDRSRKTLDGFNKEMGGRGSLTPNAPKADEGKAAKALAAAEDLEAIARRANLDAMTKETEEARRSFELKKAYNAYMEEWRKIEKDEKAGAPAEAVAAARLAIEQAYYANVEGIERESQIRRATAERRFNDWVSEQQGDTLKRKLTALKNDLDHEIELYQQRTGKIVDETTKAQILKEREARETEKFNQAEIARIKELINLREQASGGKFSVAQQIAELDALAIAHVQKYGEISAAMQQYRTELELIQARQADGWGGFMAGLQEFSLGFQNEFERMKNVATTAMGAIQSTMTNAIASMLQGQITFKDMLKQIWKGILQAIAQAVAGMIVNWILANTFGAYFTGVQIAQANQRKAASLEAGAAGAWEAYGSIPYVGWALAMAQIAMMVASVAGVGAAASAIGGGSSMANGGTGSAEAAGYAQGGLITRPTLAMIGEGRDNELIAPESTFLDWVTSVGNPAMEKAIVSSATPLVLQLSGNTFLTGVEETRQMLADFMHNALQDRDRRKG